MNWRTSSRCTTHGCVQVAPLPEGVAMRDTTGRTLTFTRQEWAGFIARMKNGAFDAH